MAGVTTTESVNPTLRIKLGEAIRRQTESILGGSTQKATALFNDYVGSSDAPGHHLLQRLTGEEEALSTQFLIIKVGERMLQDGYDRSGEGYQGFGKGNRFLKKILDELRSLMRENRSKAVVKEMDAPLTNLGATRVGTTFDRYDEIDQIARGIALGASKLSTASSTQEYLARHQSLNNQAKEVVGEIEILLATRVRDIYLSSLPAA